jgi:hypothetical protein
MNMSEAATAFVRQREAHEAQARQRAALALACGLDIDAALASSGRERIAIIRRVERLLERERQRGCRRHWSYDLNRHIALKQVRDRRRLEGAGCCPTKKAAPAGAAM